MRRILSILSLGLVLGLGVRYIISQQGNQPADRYYVGIGVQLYQVEENIVTMFDNNGQEYSNADQKLTGLVVLRKLLKNGPAEAAGLRDMDVVVGLDGRDGPPSEQVLNDAIRSGKEGEMVRLKIRRIDKDGNTLNEFEIDVRRGIIDRVSWLTMDTWITGGSRGQCGPNECDYNVSFNSRVHEDKASGKFVYDYKIENSGTKAVMVKWEALKLVGVKSEVLVASDGFEQLQFSSPDFPEFYYPAEMEIVVQDSESSGLLVWLTGSSMVGGSMPAFVPADRVN